MTTGLERTQVQPFLGREGIRARVERWLRWHTVLPFAAEAVRRSPRPHHTAAAVGASARRAAVPRGRPAPRARDVHDAAMLRGTIPPSF